MTPNALDRLVCPDCLSPLRLARGEIESGRIRSGELCCDACRRGYPVTGGVARFPVADGRPRSATARTRQTYDFTWTRFGRREVEEQWDKDSRQYSELIPAALLGGPGAIGLEAGCGGGADLLRLAASGAHIVACDVSDAVEHVSAMTEAMPNVTIVQADIHRLPFGPATFDFIYSFGVLHHLPNPQDGFARLSRLLKPGAPLITYLYEDFSDRSRVERAVLALVRQIRRVTSPMPPRLLYALCAACAPLVWVCCAAPVRLLRPVAPGLAERIPFRHTLRLAVLASDLFDRFAPPEEHRYSADGVRRLYERAGLERVEIRRYRGWVSWGYKPAAAAAPDAPVLTQVPAATA